MLLLYGAGVGKGIAIGTAFVLEAGDVVVPEYQVPEDEVENEVARFQNALDAARWELRDIGDHIPDDAPSEAASFLKAHLLMLSDPLIAEEPIRIIRTEYRNAEAALDTQAKALVKVFAEFEDPYFRSKQTDIEQVVSIVQRNLLQIEQEDLRHIDEGLEGKIIVSRDLSPADTVLLKHHKMAAFATDLGGPISHTAILARSLHLPAIVGLHGATRYIKHGEPIIVDGKRGVIIINPDDKIIDAYHERQRYIARVQQELAALITADSVTTDGTKVELLANIELPEEVEEARKFHVDGVGLYRTEFLYMNRSEPPTEAEQYAAYTKVGKALKRPITIRTLDLGADKQVDGGRKEAPTNPALGLRAVRLCLHDPGLFRPQLRAVLRASAATQIQVMIPMLSSLDELDQTLAFVEETKQDLKREGLPYDDNMHIGGMIEVPAAAVAADLFAQRLDFLSIGTNDLIQYTLAIDRIDDAVNYLYDPLHPSVLRLIKMTIDAGNRAGIPVSMCGEMAGESQYTRLLLGLGLRIFSMDPAAVPEVKKKIRSTDLAQAELEANEIMECFDTGSLRDLVAKFAQH